MANRYEVRVEYRGGWCVTVNHEVVREGLDASGWPLSREEAESIASALRRQEG